MRLSYYVPSRDEQSERIVDPRGVVTAHGFTYLDAWCHSAEAPRLFRLDRIAEAEVLDSEIQTEPEPPRDLGKEGFFESSPESTVATLELDPAARWVVEYYPVQAVRRRRGGGSRWTWSSPTSAGSSDCCSGSPRTRGCSPRRRTPTRSPRPPRTPSGSYN